MTTPLIIKRLDRSALAAGIELQHRGKNGRSFFVNKGRELRYKPGGKGIVKAQVFVYGDLDAEATYTQERMERLFASVSNSR